MHKRGKLQVALGLPASYPELQPKPDCLGVPTHIHPRECPLYWSIRYWKGKHHFVNTRIDNFCSFATFRNRDPVQDPFDPVLQGRDLPEVEQLHLGGGGVDQHRSPLGDSHCEPRPHQRDQALLLGTQE